MGTKEATADRIDSSAENQVRQQRELDAEGDRLYETYVKPLEQEHWGRLVAVAGDGRTLLGDDLYDVVDRATDAFGRGNYVFKVGEVVVWKMRCLPV